MKIITTIILTFFMLVVGAHGTPYLNSKNLEFSFVKKTGMVEVVHKPKLIDVQVLLDESNEFQFRQQSKPNLNLSDMEEKLEKMLLESIPKDSVFLRFYNSEGINVLTEIADELVAFTSHQGGETLRPVNDARRFFSVSVPKGLGVIYAEIYLKDQNEETLTAIMDFNISVSQRENPSKWILNGFSVF